MAELATAIGCLVTRHQMVASSSGWRLSLAQSALRELAKAGRKSGEFPAHLERLAAAAGLFLFFAFSVSAGVPENGTYGGNNDHGNLSQGRKGEPSNGVLAVL